MDDTNDICVYPCTIFALPDSLLKPSIAGITRYICGVIGMHQLRRALKDLIAIANFSMGVCTSSER